MRGQYQTVVLGLVVIILLAGCSGLATESEPEATVGEVETEIQAETVAVVFNNTVAAEYAATVTLESPSGTIIAERSTGEDDGISRIAIPEPTAGTYTIELFRNDQLQDTQTVSLTAADPRATVTGNWESATLAAVVVTVANTGDLPTNASVTVSNEGSTLASTVTRPVGGGSDTVLSIAPADGLYTATERGPIEFDVVVATDNNTITKPLSRTIQPAAVEVAAVTPTWQTTALTDLSYRVSNTGELPATLNGSVTVDGATAVEIPAFRLGGNDTMTINTAERATTGSGPLYSATTGPTETRVRLRYDTTTVSAGNTSIVTSTSAALEDVQTAWITTNRGSLAVSDISFRVQTAASSVTYDTLRVETATQTVVVDELEPGTIITAVDKSYYLGGGSQIELPPGEHELTVSLLDGDELVVTHSVVVTADSS